jgi:hypothetical protein
MQRGADNGLIVATAPIHVVTTPARHFAEGWRRDPLSTAARAPVLVPLWIVGDLFFTSVSAVDLALTPVWIPSEPCRPRFYDLRRFPPRLRKDALDDAGEATAGTMVFAAPFVGFFLFLSGKGTWDPPATTPGAPPPR